MDSVLSGWEEQAEAGRAGLYEQEMKVALHGDKHPRRV